MAEEIELIHATQTWLDEDWIGELCLRLRAGESLPPISLSQYGKDLFCADGHHRLSAYLREGRKTIPATVKKGTGRKPRATWR